MLARMGDPCTFPICMAGKKKFDGVYILSEVYPCAHRHAVTDTCPVCGKSVCTDSQAKISDIKIRVGPMHLGTTYRFSVAFRE